ncbi:MAG: type IX secretion system sortase PorU [Bacteroidales bacterium]|nr:type IX secretion system sortase PorU [Bacteroidales bacterium]
MLRFLLVFAFTYVMLQPAWSQTYSVTVPWKTSNATLDNSFDKAIYFDKDALLPHYYALIPLNASISNSSAYDVTITNMVYTATSNTNAARLLVVQKEYAAKHATVAIERKQPYIQVTIPALRVNASGTVERLVSFDINASESRVKAQAQVSKGKTVASSVLAQGKWVKVAVSNSDVYKISYAKLASLGFSNPHKVTVWGHGGKMLPFYNNAASSDDLVQIPVRFEKGSDGIFNQTDYLLFFAQGPVTWSYNAGVSYFEHEQHLYSQYIYYYLTDNVSTAKEVPTIPSNASFNKQTGIVDAYAHFERNDTNLIKSGRDWFGESFDIVTTQRYNTKLAYPASGSSLKVRARVAARSSLGSSFSISQNGVSVGTIWLSGVSVGDELSDFMSVKTEMFSSTLQAGNLELSLSFNKPSPSSSGWLDYLSVNARQQLVFTGSPLLFRDTQTVGTGNTTKFSLSGTTAQTKIWDITSIFDTQEILVQNGEFSVPTEILREFIAFDPAKAPELSSFTDVPNQNLHAMGQPNMVIVSHPIFLSQAEGLAELHRQADNLSVVVVTTEQVYNEFSAGVADPTAIRNMMRMLYNRASTQQEIPRYLLLFGDGSYDNVSTKKGNTNLIPTFQSSSSTSKTSSFVTDDYFGLLDANEGEANGLIDIGIGRFPVSTQEQANTIINKINSYYNQNNAGDWQNQLCFIGDDEDGNVHMRDANILADYVKSTHPSYNVQKIFFDAYPQQSSSTGEVYPDVNTAINNRVNNGALIVNYTGHGNERWLAHEKVVMKSDILSWRNFNKLNVFVTATCEFSRFDDYNLISAGEWVLLSPKGGAVALLSTTRLVYSSPNFVLNQNFIETVFSNNTDNGEPYHRLGDVVRITKRLSGTGYNKRNFMLLGDPAISLKYPKYTMSIDSINGKPLSAATDTIKALSQITIKGRVTNGATKERVNFNGTGSVTLFDKEKTITTLANNQGATMNFLARDNTIYKGNMTISDGYFSASFITPKDINYSIGMGRISTFAKSGEVTASGYNNSVPVGGINSSYKPDNHGPEIKIHLNDKNFVSGGTSDANPKLLIFIKDSSGVNTTGTGIGHDLVATINGVTEKNIVLNDYYEADLDSYQQGKVEFQLTDLSEGINTITVKAWDVHNNSSTATLSFNVVSDSKLKITHLLNYPNPFTQTTGFFFEHNQPGNDIDVLIQIFSPSGKLVKTIRHTEPNSLGYRVGPIHWDGSDDFGSRIGRGVYFYKVRIRTSNGKSAEQFQKLVMLK